MKEKKCIVKALGCRCNKYEAQAMKEGLEQSGYTSVESGADLCIINTCSVTKNAERHSRHLIRDLIRKNAGAKIVVTGCFASREKSGLEDIEGIDLIVPNSEKESILEKVDPLCPHKELSISRFDGYQRAFLKIQDGCNSFCSYCIIPFLRLRSRSKPMDHILKEASDLVANGFLEIVLTGINIGDFQDGDKDLSDLLYALDAIEGLKRIRISSIDPQDITEGVKKALFASEKCCKNLHLVLQSGSNATLKRMNRKYTKQLFLNTVRDLLAIDPAFTFTTDVIVGFPGETEEDFQETCNVVEEVGFAKVHVFPFSERPNTLAARMENKVPHEVIEKRRDTLLEIAQKASFACREKWVGKKVHVLIEGQRRGDGFHFGHTEHFLPVCLKKKELFPNTIEECTLVANEEEYLIGGV